jgi:hypothetical protein
MGAVRGAARAGSALPNTASKRNSWAGAPSTGGPTLTMIGYNDASPLIFEAWMGRMETAPAAPSDCDAP